MELQLGYCSIKSLKSVQIMHLDAFFIENFQAFEKIS